MKPPPPHQRNHLLETSSGHSLPLGHPRVLKAFHVSTHNADTTKLLCLMVEIWLLILVAFAEQPQSLGSHIAEESLRLRDKVRTMASIAFAKLFSAVLDALANNQLRRHDCTAFHGEAALGLGLIGFGRPWFCSDVGDLCVVCQFAVLVYVPVVECVALIVELNHRGVLLAVPVQFVLGFGSEVGQVDFQCGPWNGVTVIVVKPNASSLVALVVDVDVGRVPLFYQLCFAVGTCADSSPELNITSFGPIPHPSVLLAVLPSRADNRETDPITFALVVANLLQIDVSRLLALMARAHRQRHIHVRPLLDLVVGVKKSSI